MKKLSLILAAVLVLMSITIVNADQPLTLMLDNSKLNPAVAPILENGTTLVPLKTMLDAFGAKIIWNTENGSATVTKGAASLWLQQNNATVKINNVEKKLNAAPRVVNGNTMVPLSAVAEAFGATAIWDQSTNTINIFTKKAVQKQFYEDGALEYEGELVGGTYNGKGTYYWKNGDKYVGDFLDGQFQGFGTLLWASGDRYDGQWIKNERTGQGTFLWINGDKYVGQWLKGQMNGKGLMTWASGESYDGMWSNGQRSDGSAAQTAQSSQEEQFKKQALGGPSYQELNKGAARHMGKPAYFNGEIIQAIEDASGKTMLLIDTSASANSFIDMYNRYGNDTNYISSVDSKIIAVFSNSSIDLLQDDTADIYGTVTESYTYVTQAGYKMTVPALKLYTFKRTNYRSEEIYNMMFGN